MSSRPGLMNSQQAKALREAGLVQIGGTRQGRRDRPRRPLHDGAKPARTPASRPRAQLADLLAAKPARRTINEYDAKRLLAHSACRCAGASRCDARGGNPRRARSAIPSCSRRCRTTSRTRPSSAWSPSGLRRRRSRARCTPARATRPIEPRPSDAAFLVQEFVADGIEVFAGVSRDPDFGPDAGLRHGRHRDRGDARLRAAHCRCAKATPRR